MKSGATVVPFQGRGALLLGVVLLPHARYPGSALSVSVPTIRQPRHSQCLSPMEVWVLGVSGSQVHTPQCLSARNGGGHPTVVGWFQQVTQHLSSLSIQLLSVSQCEGCRSLGWPMPPVFLYSRECDNK